MPGNSFLASGSNSLDIPKFAHVIPGNWCDEQIDSASVECLQVINVNRSFGRAITETQVVPIA